MSFQQYPEQMNHAVRAQYPLKWAGKPVSAPRSHDRQARPPIDGVKYYGAVELAQTGECVVVNDVVEVSEHHKTMSSSLGPSSGSRQCQHQQRLAQVGICIMPGLYRWLLGKYVAPYPTHTGAFSYCWSTTFAFALFMPTTIENAVLYNRVKCSAMQSADSQYKLPRNMNI